MATKKRWSARVTKNSNALDLDKGVFTSGSADKIAHSLENSAKKSKRKKGTSYQSAMSMLNFYINRAGKNLPAQKKKTLEKAKDKLKELHEKDEKAHAAHPAAAHPSKTGTK
ncbi:MAG: DUF3175 domain-containing protein [Bacteroidetes bacterium]|nr:DUF3175 domain-containing protein [Bacteroidota bacterium]